MREGEEIERFGGGAISIGHAARTSQRPIALPVTFTRSELNEILRLYGRKVANGEWRDYAIDLLSDQAVFSIYRRASEVPMFRVVKQPELARKQGAFSVIAATGLIMKRGHDLARVLRVSTKGSAWSRPRATGPRFGTKRRRGGWRVMTDRTASTATPVAPSAPLRSTTASRVIAADPEALYAAFMDPAELVEWLPPSTMTGEMHAFDGVVGGGYDMSLHYPEDETGSPGKTAEREDRVNVRFLELDPPRRIVEAVTFVTDDPSLQGEMILTVTIAETVGGSEVTMLFENLPPGLDPAANEEGTRQSLQKLADWMVRRHR